jgi:voltage-gated potassium channel
MNFCSNLSDAGVEQMTVKRSLRARLYRKLEMGRDGEGHLSWISRILVVLVIVSLIMLALETEPTVVGRDRAMLRSANLLIVLIFAVEYLSRLWVAGEVPQYRGFVGRLRYMFSFYAIADLLAFLPELLLMIFAGDMIDPHFLTILKALRLFRLFKLARYIPAFKVLGEALQRASSQLFTSLFLALALVYISAIILYLIEGKGQPEAFGSIPRAIWWAIATLTTVGYGDVYPITPLGRMAASIIAVAGIGVVALPAGVFASSFSDIIREKSEKKAEERAKKTAMGLEDE